MMAFDLRVRMNREYSETCIKRTPSIKISSHINFKINLRSADADTNIKPFCRTKPAKRTLQGLFTSKSSA